MAAYNFKKITPVPSSEDFINFTLSKTQRRTPTVIHKHYKISRIRRFYMRKVKFTQQSFHDRINMMLTQFPKLEELHPFYADLLNTLYNKDHYKLSLGQMNTALHLIDRVSADYVKLLKYADSLYRCKQLKRSALGRMATIVKKQAPSLKYLEEVRQHISRLPSIDPNTRTLILCGCPNAGKSSFINMITRADVEVQPYAFTTKSLYVGHTDHDYLRWQVIDTPGILDRPFDEMNTIELQAITALAHLRAAVIFFLDISEMCDITIEQQMRIYDSVKPFFANKPFMVACSKSDVLNLKELEEKSSEKRELIASIEKDDVPVFEVSTVTKQGVAEIKKEACDRLLAQRVDMKMRSKKAESILNRIHVAVPAKRDDKERPPFIPEVALRLKQARKNKEELPKKKLEKDILEEMGEDYVLDTNKTKDLEIEEWKYDVIPTHIDGHNIADFIDPLIMQKLEALEEEEEKFIKAGVYKESDPYTEDDLELLKLGKKLNDTRLIMAINKNISKSNRRAPIPTVSKKRDRTRSVSKIRTQLSRYGVDMTDTKDAHFTRTERSRSRQPIKRARLELRSKSRTPRDQSGVRDKPMLNKVKKIEKRTLTTLTKKKGKRSESDRFIPDMKPKHLFAGKRSAGKTDRR